MAKKEKVERIKLSYRMPVDLHDDIEALASSTGRSLQEAMEDLHYAARRANMTGLLTTERNGSGNEGGNGGLGSGNQSSG